MKTRSDNYKLLLLIFACFSLVLKSYAGEKQSNISIIDSVITAVMLENLENIDKRIGDTLAIDVVNIESEKKNYLQVIIGNIAKKKSFHVVRNYNPTSSFQGLVLTIDQFNVGIEYSKPYEKSLFGKNYIGRNINIEMRGQLYSKRSTMVLAAINMSDLLSDEILYTGIEQAENSSYGFTRGSRKGYTFWDKILEPVIVVSAVAIIVYLFYTQRT